MTLWEILKANKTGIAPDMFTMLAASKMNGGRDRLHELSGVPPLSFTAKGKPLTAWSITGNTVQNGTPTPENPVEVAGVGDRTGNLFDYKKYFESTFTEYNEFFEFVEIQLKPFTTYTFTTSFREHTGATGVINTAFIIATSTEEPKTLTGGISSTRIATKTTEADGIIKIYKRTQGRILPKKEDFDSGMHWLMINEGDTALPYEPYGYKIPVVTRGKNLLTLKEVNLTIRGVAVSVKNNSITVKGTATANGGRTDYLSESFVLQPGTYFISGNIVNSLVYCLTDTSNGKAVVATSSTSKFTLTKKIKVAFGLNVISGISYDTTVNVMLNEGDKKLPYEPYHEPITTPIYLDSPLYKIGDYADRLSTTEEVRIVKELVLTGEEMWIKSSTYKGSFYAQIVTGILSETYTAFCSHLAFSTLSRYAKGKFCFNGGKVKNCNLWLNQFDSSTTVDNFKAYLAAQYAAGTPVKVYYVLATPETKTVEPVEILTLNGTTVIDVDTAVKPESMTIKYRR